MDCLALQQSLEGDGSLCAPAVGSLWNFCVAQLSVLRALDALEAQPVQRVQHCDLPLLSPACWRNCCLSQIPLATDCKNPHFCWRLSHLPGGHRRLKAPTNSCLRAESFCTLVGDRLPCRQRACQALSRCQKYVFSTGQGGWNPRPWCAARLASSKPGTAQCLGLGLGCWLWV